MISTTFTSVSGGQLNEQNGRVRAVFLDHVALLSGGEIALLNTLPALGPRIEPIVVLAEDGPLATRLRERSIQVILLPLDDSVREARRGSLRASPSTAVALVRYVWTLRRLLRELGADVVHTNSLKAAMYGGVAGRLARVPVVWHVRDRIAPDYLPAMLVRAVRLASRVLPTALVSNSQATGKTLPVASTTVPDPVTPPSPLPGRRTTRFTVGIVGRLTPWKGQDVFLRAFAGAFPDGEEQARVIGSAMFGEDAYETELSELAVALGIADRVEFRGFQDDVWQELADLDVVVHASTLPEPFGLVVLEAMASGRPVIAAGAGGPAEIITDGEDGLLSPPGDVLGLTARVIDLRRDASRRRDLGVRAQQTASHYDAQRTARGLSEVLLKAARGGG